MTLHPRPVNKSDGYRLYAAHEEKASMLENISVFIADEVQKGACRQEREAGDRELLALFTDEHLIKFRFKGVQMEDV